MTTRHWLNRIQALEVAAANKPPRARSITADMSLEEMAREYALLKDELPEWWDGSREPPPEGPIESAKAALLYAELIGDEQSIAEYRAIIAGRPIPKRTPEPVV